MYLVAAAAVPIKAVVLETAPYYTRPYLTLGEALASTLKIPARDDNQPYVSQCPRLNDRNLGRHGWSLV